MTATVVYEGNLRTVCTHVRSNSIIETDAPTDNHGKGERFSPTDLMATALGACALTTMGIKATGIDVDLSGSRVDVEKMMVSNPRRIGGINLTFHFPSSLDNEKRAFFENIAHTCPVRLSIHPDVAVNMAFHWETVPA